MAMLLADLTWALDLPAQLLSIRSAPSLALRMRLRSPELLFRAPLLQSRGEMRQQRASVFGFCQDSGLTRGSALA